MALAKNTGLQRDEESRNNAEILRQNFYKLKQTTRNHIEMAYMITMGQRTLPKLDPYCGILVALWLLGAGISRQTDPVDLLIAFVHEKKKSILDLTHEFDRSELRRQAAEYRWTLDDLKLIAAKWFQGKDEDKLLRLEKAAMQQHARYAVNTPPHVSINGEPHDTISWEIRGFIRHAWEESSAQGSPYMRLKQSLRLLGVPEKEECRVLNWLWAKIGLGWSQIRRYPWALAH